MISVVGLIKEHGSMTYEELADIIGSGMDSIDLEMRLKDLVDRWILNVSINEDDVRVFSLNNSHDE